MDSDASLQVTCDLCVAAAAAADGPFVTACIGKGSRWRCRRDIVGCMTTATATATATMITTMLMAIVVFELIVRELPQMQRRRVSYIVRPPPGGGFCEMIFGSDESGVKLAPPK